FENILSERRSEECRPNRPRRVRGIRREDQNGLFGSQVEMKLPWNGQVFERVQAAFCFLGVIKISAPFPPFGILAIGTSQNRGPIRVGLPTDAFAFDVRIKAKDRVFTLEAVIIPSRNQGLD